jgi:protein-S-isoprenylcysteine O-methyltransferase Ste14
MTLSPGPYRIIRHPIYASMFAMMIMSLLLLGKLPWWPSAIALFLTGIEIRIHAEDRLLRERFGSRFEDWKKQSPCPMYRCSADPAGSVTSGRVRNFRRPGQ